MAHAFQQRPQRPEHADTAHSRSVAFLLESYHQSQYRQVHPYLKRAPLTVPKVFARRCKEDGQREERRRENSTNRHLPYLATPARSASQYLRSLHAATVLPRTCRRYRSDAHRTFISTAYKYFTSNRLIMTFAKIYIRHLYLPMLFVFNYCRRHDLAFTQPEMPCHLRRARTKSTLQRYINSVDHPPKNQ